jgi:hypothetical protein
MGASKKWMKGQNLEMEIANPVEYEDHPFQPGPVASLAPRNDKPVKLCVVSARAEKSQLHRDVRRLDRDASRVMAH